ncbi:MAG: glycine betaine ABC transporter substrate-binding protein [Burkholderiaceae bacterium]
MKSFSRNLGALAVAGLLGLAPTLAQAADCGTKDKITIAEMTWLSAATLAHVTQRILADGYGCNAALVPGDTVPTATSMLAKSEPMIAPELWLSTAETIWEKMKAKGNVYKAGDVFASGGKEGWWIPDYFAKAHPEIKSIHDLKDHADLFKEATSDGKGRIYGCPPGWGCEIVSINLFKALNLKDSNYELFSPGSGANLKASIARKVARKQPLVAYYWGPTEVIGKYNLVRLDMPPYDAERFKCLTDKDCAKPQVTDWKSGEVAMAVVTELKTKAPVVTDFLAKVQVPNEVINKVLAWGDTESASPKEVANYFFTNHEAIWTTWVPAEVAAKVKASL